MSGQQPGARSPHNWEIRALLDADVEALESTARPPIVRPNASFRTLTQKDVQIDVDGNIVR